MGVRLEREQSAAPVTTLAALSYELDRRAGAGHVGSLGASPGSAASRALDGAMEKIWTFAATLLTGAFGLIAKLARPDLDPRSGALSAVLPTILWCGGITVLCLPLSRSPAE